jgi:hypothetical protein
MLGNGFQVGVRDIDRDGRAGILVAMAASAIIYISANFNSAPIAIMQTKMETIGKRLDQGDAG